MLIVYASIWIAAIYYGMLELYLFSMLIWLVGNFLGFLQAGDGFCWLGNINAQVIEPADASVEKASAGEENQDSSVMKVTDRETENRQQYISLVIQDADKYISPERRATAVTYLLTDFRSNDISVRNSALSHLEKLGEVESF
jgi:hypothetical protein